MAEWVLSQREQQLSVGEDVLLLTAKRALGEDATLADCYSWAVDFLLRHELSLQPADGQRQRGRLPRNIRETSRKFMSSLSTQVRCLIYIVQYLSHDLLCTVEEERQPFTSGTVTIPLCENTAFYLKYKSKRIFTCDKIKIVRT